VTEPGIILKSAFKRLYREPLVVSAILLTLALGIGANAAIFTMLDALIQKPTPGVRASDLVSIKWDMPDSPDDLAVSGYQGLELPYPLFSRLASDHELFHDLAGFASLGFKKNNAALSVNGRTEWATGSMVSSNFFSVLGVPAAAGHLLDSPTGKYEAVISFDYWSRRFGSSTETVGSSITINGVPYSIAGVAGRNFVGVQSGETDDFWIPFVDDAAIRPWASQPPNGASLFLSNRWWWITPIGRVGSQAYPRTEAKLALILRGVVDQEFGTSHGAARPVKVTISPARRGFTYMQDDFIKPTVVLMGLVTMILLTACSNIAIVMLARSESRRREMAIRAAVGASRGSLYVQLFTESAILAVCGAALGLVCSVVFTRAIGAMLSSGSTALDMNLGMDGHLILFVLGVACASVLLFGLAPAFHAAKFEMNSELRGVNPSTGAGLRNRFLTSKSLIVWQSALSVAILAGSLLLMRSFYLLEHEQLGFEPTHLFVFRVSVLGQASGRDQAAAYTRLVSAVAALPGVESASLVQNRLIDGWVDSGNVKIEGQDNAGPNGPVLYWDLVGAGFLKTTGIPLLVGRDIQPQDNSFSEKVAVINHKLASLYFPNRDPIGQHLIRTGASGAPEPYRIVGVCGDAKYYGVRGRPLPIFYVPYTQASAAELGHVNVEMRVREKPLISAETVRRAAESVDKSLLVSDAEYETDQVGSTIVVDRILARIAELFGALSLLLSCVGIYGTVSYLAVRRTKEIGLRIALGAKERQVLGAILGETLRPAVIGVLLGAAAGLGLNKLAGSILYGVSATDPWMFALACGALLLCSLGAALGPAWRAASVHPGEILRRE
jgi:predicted permease